jgi:hypothetical protein
MAESSSYNAGSLRGGGPSISLVENNHISSNAGVGNYKGVMLCNRPFAGTNGMAYIQIIWMKNKV